MSDFQLTTSQMDGLEGCWAFVVSGSLNEKSMTAVNNSITSTANASPTPVDIVIDVTGLTHFPSIWDSIPLSRSVTSNSKIRFIVLITQNRLVGGMFTGISKLSPDRFYKADNMQSAREFLAKHN
jgi:hypothetical protein